MHKTSTAYLTPAGASKLTGGADPSSVHFHIDFTASGIDSLRQAWLTFAPALNYDSGSVNPALVAYQPSTWSAVFTNWTLADPSSVLPLKIAGPGSVTVGSRDFWASFTGTGWSEQAGFYFRGFARQSSQPDRPRDGHVLVPVHAQSVPRHVALFRRRRIDGHPRRRGAADDRHLRGHHLTDFRRAASSPRVSRPALTWWSSRYPALTTRCPPAPVASSIICRLRSCPTCSRPRRPIRTSTAPAISTPPRPTPSRPRVPSGF